MRRRRVLAVFFLVAAAVGCDMGGEVVPGVCVQIGAQCQLPNGPLGVCQQRPCAAGESPPCFACTSQH